MSHFKQSKVLHRVNSTVSSGGTLTLVNSSARYQQITGSSSHTIVLPDTTTLPKGISFVISNRGSGTVLVNYNGGSLAKTLSAGTQCTFVVFDNATSAGDWDVSNEATSGGGASLSTADKLSAVAALGNGLYSDSETITSLLKYNPEEIGADSWLTRSSLATARHYLSGFELNGYGYSTGGVNGTTTVERYDDTNNFWISRGATSLNRVFSSDFAVGGFGFVVGSDTPTATGEKYNDSLNTWSAITSIAVAAGYSAAGALDGYGILAGGYNGAVIGTTQIYDSSADAWYSRSPQNIPEYSGNNGAVYSGKFYVVGGDNASFAHIGSTQSFASASNTWTTKNASLNTARQYLPVFAINGFLYAGPGYNGSVLTTLEEYLEDASAWKVKSPVTTGRFGMCLNNLNGIAYLSGGSTSGGGSSTAVNESYRNVNFFRSSLVKKSTLAPSAMLVSATLNDVAQNCPVRVRTDGDNWKYVLANSDGFLKLNETARGKLVEAGLGYVFGGDDAVGTYRSAVEFYNDTQNSWIVRQSLASARGYFGGFKLRGLGYIVSGLLTGSVSTATVLAYDDISNSYTSKASIGVARQFPNGFQLNDFGYATGGGGPVATVDRYSAASDSWLARGSLNTARSDHAAWVQNGRGYVNQGVGATTEQYSDITNVWTVVASSSSSLARKLCFSGGGYGYSLGGSAPNSVNERYDDQANSYSTKTSMNSARSYGSGWYQGGFGYAAGGAQGSTPLSSAEQYNSATDSWTNKTSMGTSRQALTSGVSPGAYRNYEVQVGLPAYAAGAGSGVWLSKSSSSLSHVLGAVTVNGAGYAHTTGAATSEKYDLVNDVWTQHAPTNTARNSSWSFSLGGFGYIGDASANTEQLNDSLNVWTNKASKNTLKDQTYGSAFNGFGFVAGGGPAATAVAEQYNAITNAWTTKTSMGSTRITAAGGSVSGYYFVCGGGASASNTTEYYNDTSNAWTAGTNLNISRLYPGAFVRAASGSVMVCGAITSNTNTSEEYMFNAKVSLNRSNFNTGQYQPGSFSAGNDNNFLSPGGLAGAATQQYVNSLSNALIGVGLRVTES